MKYMIMMFSGVGDSFRDRTPEWISNMHAFLQGMDRELRDNGELVGGGRLVGPESAVTVRFRDGAPVPTDGPYAEIKESMVGYWIIEASAERAVEVAAQVAACVEHPIEVRQVMDQPAQL